MAYSADSFVADEQPTTAKWNKLWTNDASFNDGTGIATGAITSTKISGIDKSLTTTDSNPYKFSVYRTAAQNTSAGAEIKINFDGEYFDTNSNFDSTTNYRYTVPVSGFYQVSGYVNVSANPGTFLLACLYKNGSILSRGVQTNNSAAGGVSYSDLIQLTAGDYIELFVFASNTVAMDVANVHTRPRFSGYLVSRT